MAEIPTINQPGCRYRKSNGEYCQRTVAIGEGMCWQHAKTFRHRFRSLTKNQTVGFFGLLLSLALAIFFGIISWPTASNLTGFLQIGEYFFRPENSTLANNRDLDLNVFYINRSSEPVNNGFGWTALILVDHPGADALLHHDRRQRNLAFANRQHSSRNQNFRRARRPGSHSRTYRRPADRLHYRP